MLFVLGIYNVNKQTIKAKLASSSNSVSFRLCSAQSYKFTYRITTISICFFPYRVQFQNVAVDIGLSKKNETSGWFLWFVSKGQLVNLEILISNLYVNNTFVPCSSCKKVDSSLADDAAAMIESASLVSICLRWRWCRSSVLRLSRVKAFFNNLFLSWNFRFIIIIIV